MTTSEQFAVARRHMVESQLRPNRLVDDRVAEAMARVPRELFVPKAMQGVAYLDEDIRIAPDRYLMEPMVFARLLQAAEIGGEDTVLDIGCGSGYSTAVIGQLAGTVVALECAPDLAARAIQLTAKLEVDNAVVVEGDLADGLADQGPYDVIVLNGSVPRIPAPLADQIAEKGRVLAVLSDGRVGRATIVSRTDGLISERALFDAASPPLPDFERQVAFEF